MFGKKFKLFDLFGFSVYIDASWFIIVALIVWSLAKAYFPANYEGLSGQVYWTMGLAAALGLFISILLHEYAHSLVARYYGIPIEGITLFIFGGVAEMKQEPPNAKVEFLVAIAGPIASVIISLLCVGLGYLGGGSQWPLPIVGVLTYLGFINAVLVVFNCIPAFPLDGGRVLRAALWHFRGSLRSATRTTASLGEAFGLFLIVLGVISIISGNFIGGMWQCLIGMFLRSAAQMSYQHVLIRRALEGEQVRRFMQPDPVTVSPETTVEALVDEYVYRFHHKLFPVVQEGQLVGCVTIGDVRNVPRDQWQDCLVGQIQHPCDDSNTIEASTDAVRAMATMNQSGKSRLLVVEGKQLCGIVTLKDLLKFIELKIELENGSPPPRSGRDR